LLRIIRCLLNSPSYIELHIIVPLVFTTWFTAARVYACVLASVDNAALTWLSEKISFKGWVVSLTSFSKNQWYLIQSQIDGGVKRPCPLWRRTPWHFDITSHGTPIDWLWHDCVRFAKPQIQLRHKRYTHSRNGLDAGRNITLLLMTYYCSSWICMSSGCHTWRRPGKYRHSDFFVCFARSFLFKTSKLCPFPTPYPSIWRVYNSTVELHLPGLIGMICRRAEHLFENRQHWSLKRREKNSTSGCLRLHIYLRTNKTLIHSSLYVFYNWGKI
jgi:hypothetical protein